MLFYPLTKMHALICIRYDYIYVTMFGDSWSYVFFVRSFGCALFISARQQSIKEESFMRCQHCGINNKDTNTVCEVCGAPLGNTVLGDTAVVKPPKRIWKKGEVITLIAMFAIIAAFLFFTFFYCVISPRQARSAMEAALDSKDVVAATAVCEKYCNTDTNRNSSNPSPAAKVTQEILNDFFDQAYADVNNYSIDEFNELLMADYGNLLDTGNGYLIQTAKQSGIVHHVHDISYLMESKNNILTGMDYYYTGDWENAIANLSHVNMSDSWYDTAQEMLQQAEDNYFSDKIEAINTLIESGDYETTEAKIDDINLSDLSEANVEKVNDQLYKIYDAKLSAIDNYIETGNTEEVSRYITSLKDNLSVQGQERLAQAVTRKANEYLTKADEALRSNERQAAYNNALSAQALRPDDEAIVESVAYYQAYLPFELHREKNHLSIENHNKVYVYYSVDNWDKLTANDGTVMPEPVGIGYCATSVDSSLVTVTYKLGGAYNDVTGTAFIPSSFKNDEQTGYFIIYGDGKKLYTSTTFTKNVLPQAFSVDVSNIDILTVEYYGSNAGWGGDYAGYYISNLVATKKIPE